MEKAIVDMATVGGVAGASVRMFLKDHHPPHVHVWYQGSRAKLDIASETVLKGRAPRSAERRTSYREEGSRVALIDELHVVRAAVPLPDCTLLLEFEDGSLRVIDLSSMAREPGVLPRLADQSFFEQVRVDEEAGTVVWPDDIDLDPDVLYRDSVPVSRATVRDLIAQARQRP